MLCGEGAARLTVDVGDLHAPRVVDQHTEEVLLRHSRLDDEHRAEEAEEHQQKGREADAGEHGAMPHVALAARAPIRQDRDRDGRDDHGGSNVRAGRRCQTELALLKDDRPVIEQQPKDRIEHACPPWHQNKPSPGVDCITARGALRTEPTYLSNTIYDDGGGLVASARGRKVDGRDAAPVPLQGSGWWLPRQRQDLKRL